MAGVVCGMSVALGNVHLTPGVRRQAVRAVLVLQDAVLLDAASRPTFHYSTDRFLRTVSTIPCLLLYLVPPLL